MKKTTFKDSGVDISFRSKPFTKEEEMEISEFTAKRKNNCSRRQKR